MTRDDGRELAELARVFSGYLHEDFAAEHGSPAAALRAYRGDASAPEWRRFRREARRLITIAASGDFDRTRALLERLGSRWSPPSPEALITVLRDALDLPRPPTG